MRFGSIGLRLLLAISTAVIVALVSAAAATASTGAVTVQGAHLLRDGAVWLPRGVQIVGLVAPDGSLSGRYVDANAHFGEAELEAARAAQADVIRFQVSQYGLDPEDPLFSSAYVREVQHAVEMARALGLTVIVSLQAERFAGRTRVCPLPDASAQRVWQELTPMFATDPGVMYELFNEPSLLASRTNWQLWAYGGTVTQNSAGICQAVGMQTLIDEIRGDSATNVIIVPGLAGEKRIAGMPALTDPMSPASPQLAFGVHYPQLGSGSTVWDRKFGNASASVPVIVTEWYASSFRLCSRDEPAKAAWLLAYLASKQIGVVGYAFDVPGTIVSNWSWAPTDYSHFACEAPLTPGATPTPGPHSGPGQLLFDEFAGLAQAGSASLNDPRGWIVTHSALLRLGQLASNLVRHFLDTPRTFVIGASAPALRRGGLQAAVPTASFTSESALASAVRRDALPAGTRAVVFDDENWRRTPRSQQLYPAVYYQRAARVAHEHGLMLIAAPAPDIALARNPRLSNGRIYTAFLNRRIAAGAARYADVYDVQAAGLETKGRTYATFVQQASFQATQAHPGVEVLAGISTDPSGHTPTPSALLSAAAGAGSAVSGYWLNDPAGGSSCSACAGRFDRAAVGFLSGLRSEGF